MRKKGSYTDHTDYNALLKKIDEVLPDYPDTCPEKSKILIQRSEILKKLED